MTTPNKFPCNTCDLSFENSPVQRAHMRDPWHIYNIRRRIASVPPISKEDYTENVATSLVSSKRKPWHANSTAAVLNALPEEETVEESEEADQIDEDETSPNRCLFCSRSSDNFQANLEHMTLEHGLHIPQIEHLSSVETMIGYLRTVVSEYHECLYCGSVKQSAHGIRQHMLDKGHCMINFEREPELLEFWEFSDSDAHSTDDDTDSIPTRTGVSLGERTLSSGKIVGTKSRAREDRALARRAVLASREAQRQSLAAHPIDDTSISSSTDPSSALVDSRDGVVERAVATRDVAGLIGVSDQQMRSLITVQRKMQRQEAVVHASASWAGELGGRHQKHYKVKMNLRAG